MKRKLIFSLLVAVCCSGILSALPAQAALYGYVDEKGEVHFSSKQEDERYQLFMKDGETQTQLDKDILHSQARSARAARQVMGKQKISSFAQNMVFHPSLKKLEPLIKRNAKLHGIEDALIKAVIAAESGFNAEAISPKGAVGLMQIIPATAERYGLRGDAKKTLEDKLKDPATNIAIGVKYLRDLTKLFAGKEELILAAYNAGEGAVQKYRNQIPPYPETQNYVMTVQQLSHLYAPIPKAATTSNTANNRVHIKIGGRRNMPE